MEELLIETSRHVWRYSPLFVEIVSMIQRNAIAELEDHFGEGITIDKIFEHIPIIEEYLQEEEEQYLDLMLDTSVVESIGPIADIQCEENNTFYFTEECIICYENQSDVRFNCKLVFCGKCIKTHISINIAPLCPNCRDPITRIEYNNESSILH